MRRLWLLAALTAGSTVLYGNQAPVLPSISSLQSGAAFGTETNGAAITAGTPISDFWLYINGVFNNGGNGLTNTVKWTSAAAPNGQVLQFANVPSGPALIVVDVPANLFASQDSATVTVTQTCLTFNCTATSNGATFTVNPPLAALVLPAGMVGQAYSQPLASGGTGNYTLTYLAATGPLPPGMTGSYLSGPVNQANTNFSGTPTTLGTYPFMFQVTDAWNNSITANYSLAIIAPPTISSLSPASCTASTSATAGCTTGAFPLQINGANFYNGLSVLWDGSSIGAGTVNSAALITVSAPHNVLTVGTHFVSVAAFSNGPVLASNRLPFVVNPAPSLTSLQPNSVTVGSPAFSMTVNGANFLPGMTVQWQGPTGASLLIPSTLSATQITVRVPAGLVAATGTASVTVLSADPIPVASNSLPLAVTPAPLPPLIITTSSPLTPPATVGVDYGNVIAANGGDSSSYTFTIAGGVPPPGIGLSSNGQMVGFPTSPGTFTFTVQVTDGSGNTAGKAFTLVVNPAPLAITTPPFAAMPVGSSLNVTFAARGGVPPYVFSSSGTLPPNAQFGSGGTLTATLNTPGTYAFSVTVTDSVQNTASQGYTITVTGTALAIVTTSPLPSGQVGVAYPGVQFQAKGGLAPYTWTAGSAPPGMSFSGGALSGTPTAAGNYSISVTVTDSAKATASGPFAIAIAALTITTASLPNGAVGTAYSAPNMTATGGVGTLTWSASGLPAGISLSSGGGFSGTPTAAGSASVTITVEDSDQNTASQSYALTVNPAPPPPLKITQAGAVPAAVVGSSFTVGFNVTGGTPPYSFSVSGLPAGLSVSSSTGGISGAPTAPGNSAVTVTVKDSAGATASTTFTVSATLPATPPLSFSGNSTSLNPGSQSSVGVSLGSAYPVAVTVTLTLTFTGTDPAVQFATGGTTATITVPAEQTTGSTTVGVQTGTVAGVITIVAKLTAGGVDITPSPAPTSTITVPATAPGIASMTAVRNSTGFTVTIVGYSSTLALTTANFTFNGTNLGTTTLSIPVSTIFASWYQSSTAGQYGSNFTYTQPFTTSNPQAITSVTVTLVNGVGTSAVASANLQ